MKSYPKQRLLDIGPWLTFCWGGAPRSWYVIRYRPKNGSIYEIVKWSASLGYLWIWRWRCPPLLGGTR